MKNGRRGARRWSLLVGAGLVMLILAVTACGGGSSASSNGGGGSSDEVKLGIAVAGDFNVAVPHLVAEEQGFFKKEHLDVKTVAFQGGADLVKALAAGSVDIGGDFGPDAPAAVAKGVEIKAFAGVAAASPFKLICGKNGGVGAIQDLKGKRVGITRFGSLTDFVARKEAEKAGLDPKQDLKEVPLGAGANLAAALTAGRIDCFNWGPELAYPLEDSGAKLVMSFADIQPDTEYTYLAAKPDYLNSNKDVVKRFLTAYFDALRYLKDHPGYGVKKTAQALSMKPAVAKRVYDTLVKNFTLDGQMNEAGLKTYADALPDLGLAPTRPQLDTFYTSEFVPVQTTSG